MRLSEAMMLGDSLRTRDASSFLHNGERLCGCAIGGAWLAVGVTPKKRLEFGLKETELTNKFWPWVPGYFMGRVSSMFIDVCDGTMTFEQLVDYVHSIEPECGECNRFECICKPAAIPEFENELILAAAQR